MKQDVSVGCSNAHDMCCSAGCALDVIGEMIGLIPAGKVETSFGLSTGETYAGHLNLAMSASESTICLGVGQVTLVDKPDGLF